MPPTRAEYTFFTSTHGRLIKMNHTNHIKSWCFCFKETKLHTVCFLIIVNYKAEKQYHNFFFENNNIDKPIERQVKKEMRYQATKRHEGTLNA